MAGITWKITHFLFWHKSPIQKVAFIIAFLCLITTVTLFCWAASINTDVKTATINSSVYNTTQEAYVSLPSSILPEQKDVDCTLTSTVLSNYDYLLNNQAIVYVSIGIPHITNFTVFSCTIKPEGATKSFFDEAKNTYFVSEYIDTCEYYTGNSKTLGWWCGHYSNVTFRKSGPLILGVTLKSGVLNANGEYVNKTTNLVKEMPALNIESGSEAEQKVAEQQNLRLTYAVAGLAFADLTIVLFEHYGKNNYAKHYGE